MRRLKNVILTITMMITCGGITATKVAAEHMVTYDLDGGTFTTSVKETARWYEEVPAPEAEKEHYIFKGWTDGNTVMTKIKHASNDVHLKAVFVPEIYDVTFYDGDTIISRTNYAYGTGISDLSVFASANSTRHPYEDLTGWKTENGNIVTSLSQTDSGSKKLTAVYGGKTYKITYDLYDGSADGLPETYRYGEGVSGFPDASKDGRIFDGWFSDKDCTNQVTDIPSDSHSDMHLYAKYHDAPAPAAQTNTRSYRSGSDGAASYTDTSTATAAAGGSGTCSIPEIGYWANAILYGDQSDIDAKFTGVWDPEDLFSWYDENGNMMGDVDTFGPGWTYEKCGTRMNYRDHASQGLTQLPYRLSVGSVCYLNGVAYTYSGYFEVGYYPTNSSSEYRLVIETCTPNDENGNHQNYICYFN